MATLLSNTVQPPLLTLLSSTSDPAISPLFTKHVDPTDPNLSFISTVNDSSPGASTSTSTSKRRTFDQHYIGQSQSNTGDVVGQVIHIQSPRPTTTYIQAGAQWRGKGKGKDEGLPLGIELPWVGMQVKRLGRRGMAFEFGIKDTRGIEGIIRLSSYKSTPTSLRHRSPPLIHLPLNLPATDQHTLTTWLDIKLNLASLLPLFKSLPRAQDHKDKRQKLDTELPSGSFSEVTYVRVYANCRMRRIWFSADGEKTLDQAGVKDEWALYASASVPTKS